MPLRNLIVMGISTGGPKTLRRVFSSLPRLNAALVLVQHMPKFINESVCRTLNSQTEMDVHLVQDKMALAEGNVYLAPSELHTELSNNARLRLVSGPKVCYVCPSVDVTMKSVNPVSGKLIGVIMTGMGRDGADGIRKLKSIGARTIAQDEQSSIIWGMPSAAIETGTIDEVLNPEQIREKLISLVGIQNPAKI